MVRGIYIHIPFCNTKCPYCDFMSFVSDNPQLINDYVETVLTELSLYIKQNYRFYIETVYFGGGTPSILETWQIVRIIEFIKENINHQKDLEITVECNPETYRYEEFKMLKNAGVNRISIGNQSFLEKNLETLGRKHKPKDTFEMIESAVKAGIRNVNVDMIYAIPGQSFNDLKEDLEIYTSLPVTHISAYMLTAYEETQFRNLIDNNIISLPDEDTSSKMFLMVDEFLEEKGFKRYEVSNWAKDSFNCKHNLLYWTHGEFLGVGVSAWSFVENRRFGNDRNFESYMEKVKDGKLPVAFEEYIDRNEYIKERIFLGLRLRNGVEIDILNKKKVEELLKNGYAEKENGRLILTRKGVLVINEIVRYLLK